MLHRLALPIVAVFMLILAGCQSSMLRSFDKLHPGMDKHQVLELVGSPNATTRLHGRDRWIYRFYDEGIRFDREVQFFDGFAVFIGEPAPPAPGRSAEAIDKKNEEEEVVLQAEVEKKNEDRKKNADLFRQYEIESRNRDGKVKYLPRFVEVK